MAKKDDGSRIRDALRIDGELPDPGATPVGPGKKPKALAKLDDAATRLSALQEALYAEGVGGGDRSVLLVLQGMDTSGKGGTVSHVLGLVNPMGVRYAGFKKPTPAERRHHYLWRIRKQLPVAGQIGVFDRSHYEDILVPRVTGLLTAAERRRRYAEINAFEKELADAGTTVVKAFLHISPEEQLKRLKARLVTPEKHWKYNPGDLEARAQWPAYQEAYADIFKRTSTGAAPWYAVPADHKWYRNWAVAELLIETLAGLKPRFPEPDYDVDAELAKLKGVGVPS
ncbi:PPK2 family polyphosphate:nucleotide phosphotransferase [Amycolatopsis lexingtonensis]|uniref:PPK2 family polyphosphate:nucleotide phosphotransferase n=1 Tax=Amycolatopsis lexingtonensis TaxID=218822 RepID=A0ABR9I161_9PSEU|nr:PPK2 family polyphosphate kinase [Amycolatopsis lexingtonensis]MBE1496884.1 PPK2 family polyphosphate:nucleotide phosphotransferase [Amycolatopsis lexingtonensis]